MGKLRKNYLYGWSLYSFFQNLTARPEIFTPPPVFEAMQKVPPPQGPFIAKKKGELIFPDDKIRVAVEKESAVARQLATQGMTPVPWYFERRSIDTCVARVKDLQRRDPNLSLKQAVRKWEEEHLRMQQIQKREVDLVTEETVKRSQSSAQANSPVGSGVISAFDSFRIMQVMRDMQIEHTKTRFKKEVDKRRAELAESTRKIEAGFVPPGLTLQSARTFQRDLKELVYREFQAIEKEEQELPEEAFSNTNELDYRLNLDQRLHPTTIRKIVAALEIERLVTDVRDLKDLAGVANPSHDENYITPFDVFAVYLRTFDDSDQYQLYEDARLYRTISLDDQSGYTLYIELHRKFRDAFARFLHLHDAEPDISSILAQLDLGFGAQSPMIAREDSKHETVLEQLGFKKPDFSPLFSALSPTEQFNELKKHQSKIEELFLLIKVGRMLRPETLKSYEAVDVFIPPTDILKAEEIEAHSTESVVAQVAPFVSEMAEPGIDNLPLPGFEEFKQSLERVEKRAEIAEAYAEEADLSAEEADELIDLAMKDSTLDEVILEEEASELFDVSDPEGAALAKKYVDISLLYESGELNIDNIRVDERTSGEAMGTEPAISKAEMDKILEEVKRETEQLKQICLQVEEKRQAEKKEQVNKLFSLGSLPKDKVSDKTTEIFKSLFELDDYSTQ